MVALLIIDPQVNTDAINNTLVFKRQISCSFDVQLSQMYCFFITNFCF